MTISYRNLLSSYAAYVRPSGHVDATAAALRTRSKLLRDVIAYAATQNKYSVEELRALFKEEKLSTIDFEPLWFAGLGRVIALQGAHESNLANRDEDFRLGLACLEIANRGLPTDSAHQQFHRLQIELLAGQDRVDEAIHLAEANEFLRYFYYGYIRTDLGNPAISGKIETFDQWLDGFNRPFIDNNLLPVQMATGVSPSFNEITTEEAAPYRGGPKVSVIMTSYEPDPHDFLLAVQSILRQSWRNLELIIVDDASPPRFQHVLAKAQELDPRVKLIKLPVNGGTYRARNAGIDASAGDFITGQDSDDWSHPERLAHQVGYMLANPSSPGVVVEAIRMDNDLVRMFPGRIPHRLCEVSLMVHGDLVRKVGGYLDARKGADSEFRRRIETFTSKEIAGIKKPLYLIRIGHESLSRGDFKPGWSHPVRRAFWNASQHWHENAKPSQVRLPEGSAAPLPVPNRFKISPPHSNPHFDAVFVGDWRAYGGMQRTMIDGITTLVSQGQRVGVMHIESPLSPSKETTRLSHELQTLINDGAVDEVVSDEDATTNVTLIHDPSILQFSPRDGINVVSELTLISTDVPPPSGHMLDVWYRPEDCDRAAESVFKGPVVWTSMDPAIRRQLAASRFQIAVLPSQMPVAFQKNKWVNNRLRLSDDSPVVGRHAANRNTHWPNDFTTADSLWPQDGAVEIRILGDARPYLRKYNKSRYPLSWVVFRDKEIRPEAFMSGIDFFVYFPQEAYFESYCRQALEAAASGALVVLPKEFEETHGGSAVYAAAHEVPEILRKYSKAPPQYRMKVQDRSSHLKQVYDNDGYAAYIQNILSTYSSPEQDISETYAQR
ncbi:MAG: glycosyltransferase [Yaniella sp.]